jgi:hypothetical protein
MSLQGSLSIERMCQMVPVSRRGFYRSLKEQQPVEEEMEGVLQGCWGRRLKCRPLPQTPSPARRYKNAVTKAEAVSKKTVPL